VVVPLLVGMDDCFGIAARLVLMAPGLEVAPNLRVVVDLAVEDNPNALILVRQRLMAGTQVDDAETPMAERSTIVRENPGLIGASMRENVAHRRRASGRVRRQPFEGNNSGNPTHPLTSQEAANCCCRA